MEMPLEEFAEWVTVVSKEMKREAKAIEEARRKARKK